MQSLDRMHCSVGERHLHNFNTLDRLCIVEPIPSCVSLPVEFLWARKGKVSNSVNFRKADTVCIEVVCVLLVGDQKL